MTFFSPLAICGSDLHMYQGRTAAESGLVFGHENMGIVTEIGEGVTLLKKGDRIVLPFNVADGRCRNCEEGKTAFCTGMLIDRGPQPPRLLAIAIAGLSECRDADYLCPT